PDIEKIARKDIRESSISHIEPAGKAAEGRHDQAPPITDKAARPEPQSAPRNGGHWVQMTGDFRFERQARRWFMAQQKGPQTHRNGNMTAQIVRRGLVMVPGQPYDLVMIGQKADGIEIVDVDSVARGSIMETVSQRHDPPGPQTSAKIS